MSEGGKRQKIRDRDDLDYKVVFTSFIRNDIGYDEHPFAIICGREEGNGRFEITAFFSTSDKKNSRRLEPGRFYPLLKSDYPFLANDTYVDTWSYYRGESGDFMGKYANVAGKLSEKDAVGILESYEKGRRASKTMWSDIRFVPDERPWGKDRER